MNVYDKLLRVKTIACLVDGVLTDGVYYMVPGSNNDFMRGISKQDTIAFQLANKIGVDVVLISGSEWRSANKNIKALGMATILGAVINRTEDVQTYCSQRDIEMNELLFIGDDYPDYKLLKMAGVAVSPCTAASSIQEISDYVTNAEAGKGCLREVVDMIIETRGIDASGLF